MASYSTATTQGSQDPLAMFYDRAMRALDKMDSTPIAKPLNYIDSLDENLQRYISEFLSPYESYDWELACQGEDILTMIEEEYDEDETRDWRDEPRQDWEDDFDLYQDWEQGYEEDDYDEDDRYDYGDCFVDDYGSRIHNARFSV